MYKKEVLDILEKTGALVKGGHFVYASGRHGHDYLNKDAIYPHTKDIAWMCERIAWYFYNRGIIPEVVVGPALGGVIISHLVARTLARKEFRYEVLTVYAEKVGNNFDFTRGYDKLVRGKKVLVVEDVLNSGGSAGKIVNLVRSYEGVVLAVGALCNRGNVTAEILDVPELYTLIDIDLATYMPKECPLCKESIPINQDLGKGKEFLAAKTLHS